MSGYIVILIFTFFLLTTLIVSQDNEYPKCMRRIVHPSGLLYLDECNISKYLDYNLYNRLLNQFIKSNHIIVEINSGYGLELLKFAELLGEYGNIITIEESIEYYQYLSLTIQHNDYYNRTLLLNSNISSSYFDSMSLSNELFQWCQSQSNVCGALNRFSLTHLYDLIDKQCVHFLAFNSVYGDRDSYSSKLFDVLRSGYRMLLNCKPTIYIDHISTRDSQSVLNLLTHLNYSVIYFLAIWKLDVNGSVIDLSRAGLLAVGSPHDEITSDNELNMVDIAIYRYIIGNYYIFQYIDLNDYPNITSESIYNDLIRVCVDGSLPPCHNYEHTTIKLNDGVYTVQYLKYAPSFSNPLPMLRVSISTCLLYIDIIDLKSIYLFEDISLLHEDILSVIGTNDSLRELTIHWDRMVSSDSIQSIATSMCFCWLQEITSKLPDRYNNSIDLNNLVDRLIVYDSALTSLITACSSLMRKQYHIIRSIITHAQSQSSITTVTTSHTDSFDPRKIEPFRVSYDYNKCFEPVWCDHSIEMQRRIRAWQFPDDPYSYLGSFKYSNRSCSSSKFLIYEPASDAHGIGSMIEQIASTLRYAMCYNRILILMPFDESNTTAKWRMDGCRGSFYECYFSTIQGCSSHLTYHDIASAPKSDYGRGMDRYPLANSRIVRLVGYPTHGKCILCGSDWTGNIDLFDGLLVNEFSSFIPQNDQKIAIEIDPSTAHMKHFNSMLTSIKLPWASQFIRYLLQPRPWLIRILQMIVCNGLIGPLNSTVCEIPHPFASVHIRYGMKAMEEKLHPLDRYMNAVKFKLGHVKNIFLSTETEEVIGMLRRDYPDYNFYHLAYPRLEYLDLSLAISQEVKVNQDFVGEFVYSMANLYVSTEADGFVGTLTSNWCTMIEQLQRTRGDGGSDYWSIDKGSAFSSCF